MSNEIEYIEPTQEHVGQMVEVEDAGRYLRNDWLEDCDKNIILIEKGKW